MRSINFGSWKTTLSGIAGILTGLGMLGKVVNDFMIGEPVQFNQVAIAVTAIGAGITGITARDNDKSSQDVGVR